MKNTILFLVINAFTLMPVWSQKNDTIKSKRENLLKEIVVLSKQKGATNIGKSLIKIEDLPQSAQIIEKEILEKQQIIRLSEVLKNANGIYVSGGNNAAGNNQEELGSRGFVFSGGNTFRNGIRINGSLIPETSSLESIEILKGSAALLFGNVAPGGILNLISKKPKFDFGAELNLRNSEYNFYKPTFDIYGSVNNSEKLAFRTIASYEKGNSFRNSVATERLYFNPSFLIKFSNKTDLTLEADFTNDSRTPDFGLTTIDYKIVEMPRSTFLGLDWGKFDSKQSGFTATFNHQITKNWTLKTVASHQKYNTNLLSSLRPNNVNLVQANGDWTRGIQKIDAKQEYTIAEIDANTIFKTGKIKHTFLIGSDADKSITTTDNFKVINFYDKINIYNPEVVLAKNPLYLNTNIPQMDIATNVSTIIKRAGLYTQDLIELSSKLKVLTGLRYSYLENTTNTLTLATNANVETKTNDNVISSKAGIVYQPTKKVTFFTSFSDSFVLNTGTDKFLNNLPSSTINQFEIGNKLTFFGEKFSINTTLYSIDYSNLAQTDFSNGNTNTNIKELAGAYKSEGLEIDITADFWGFKILSGYSFNETKYTKSNIFNVGTLLRFSPKHTANTSVYYTFEKSKLKGLEIGFQSTYIGDRLGGRLRPNNASTPAELARKPIETKGFLQFDATLGYSLKNLTLRLKLANIANEINYYAYDDNTITPIAPRMISTTLSYKF